MITMVDIIDTMISMMDIEREGVTLLGGQQFAWCLKLYMVPRQILSVKSKSVKVGNKIWWEHSIYIILVVFLKTNLESFGESVLFNYKTNYCLLHR
jgi:hypothetical protein